MTVKPQPPVIVAGMHRSGTTLFTRLLQSGGVFMGARRGKGTEEARLFNKLNRWLFRQVYATWDYPQPWLGLDDLRQQKLRQTVLTHLSGFPCLPYLGVRKWWAYRSLYKVTTPWGWKDPRNTFTASFWKTLFPEARILIVCRHPADVVESLRRREIKETLPGRGFKDRLKELLLTGRTRQLAGRPYLMHRPNAFALWKAYMQQGLQLEEAYEADVCRVRYEDLVAEPDRTWQHVHSFVGLPGQNVLPDPFRDVLNPERLYAYQKVQEAADFYEAIRHDEVVRKMGYDNTPDIS